MVITEAQSLDVAHAIIICLQGAADTTGGVPSWWDQEITGE